MYYPVDATPPYAAAVFSPGFSATKEQYMNFLGELLAAKDLSRATIASMVDPVIVFSARGEVLLANAAALVSTPKQTARSAQESGLRQVIRDGFESRKPPPPS